MAPMTDSDPAFLWETQALREARARAPMPDDPPAGPAVNGPYRWRTLKEAHGATGIPVDTLRKWARHEDIPSYLDTGGGQSLRMVRMDAVLARAHELGRAVSPVMFPEDGPPTIVDLRDEAAPPPMRRGDVAAPAGTMIVPIAAWDKMLMQLGNLHEAGQQLAEARERAAKAETEAVFLRERLSDLRATMPATPVPSRPEPPPDRVMLETPPPIAVQPPSRVRQMWNVMYRNWRGKWRR